jgi:hypothetical protein
MMQASRFQQTVSCAPAGRVCSQCQTRFVLVTFRPTHSGCLCMCLVLQFLCCEVAYHQMRGRLRQMTVWSVADFFWRLQFSGQVQDKMLDAEEKQQVGTSEVHAISTTRLKLRCTAKVERHQPVLSPVNTHSTPSPLSPCCFCRVWTWTAWRTSHASSS